MTGRRQEEDRRKTGERQVDNLGFLEKCDRNQEKSERRETDNL